MDDSPQESSSGPASVDDRLQQYIPKQLLAKLNAAREGGGMVGERRVVTMLFCDVQGSTAATKKLDPEEWTDIINGAFEHMIKPVYKYEGIVARLMGDAILAFFGAPIAHEDDPQRAVLAGLEIVAGLEAYGQIVEEKWGIAFDVRVGINTGRVVVGAVGSDLRMEYTAMGEAINLASRMEQAAAPGTVQIAHDTYRLVKPLFEFKALGNIQVKGLAEPVPAYRVLGRKEQTGLLRGIEGLETNLIGRDRELSRLQEVLGAVPQGVGRIVALIADAGLGKSRLVRELQSGLRLENPELDWFETGSLSYETAQPYAPFQRLIRRLYNISPGDSQENMNGKLAPLFAGFEADLRSRVRRLLDSLFGLMPGDDLTPLEGKAFKRELFALMPELWRTQFGDRPAVVIFEDMHWGDPASISLLQHLFDLVEEMPLLLICTFRPDRQAFGWQLKAAADQDYHHRYTEITLGPLSKDESSMLVDSLLDNPDLPPSLRRRVLDRSGGNPFYIEEVIRSLIDSGAIKRAPSQNGRPTWVASGDGAGIHIPENLLSLLTARIDGLAEDVRHTLQLASVIGRSFNQRVLASIDDAGEALEANLRTLMRLNLILESARVPEVEYIFSNPLTQEAAYQTILLKQRRDFHRRVAETMERLFTGHLAELAPRLAYHFGQAQEHDRAFDYLIQAGDSAFRLYANREAITHYRGAIDIADQAGATREQLIHLYRNLGRAQELDLDYDGAKATYDQMVILGRQREDKALELAALIALGTLRGSWSPLRDPEEAKNLANEALLLARDLGDEAAEAGILWNLVLLANSSGDYDSAIRNGERALVLAKRAGQPRQIALIGMDTGWSHVQASRLPRAKEMLSESEHLWRDIGDQPLLANNHNYLAQALTFSGDLAAAVELIQEADRICRSIDNAIGQVNSANGLAAIAYLFGETGRALSLSQDIMPLARHVGSIYLYICFLYRVLVLAFLGALEKALEVLDWAGELAEGIPPALHVLFLAFEAYVHVQGNDFEEAARVMQKLPEDFDYRRESPQIAMLLAPAELAVALAGGKLQQASRLSARFMEYVEGSGADLMLPEALYYRSLVLIAEGKRSLAQAALEEARTMSQEQGQRWLLWRIIGLLAETAEDDEASSLRQQAWAEVTWLAEQTGAPDLSESFLNRPDVSAFAPQADGEFH